MPPASEPIKRQCVLAVQTALQGINGGATYWNTVASDDVQVTDVAPPDVTSFPSIWITPAATGYDNPRTNLVRTVAGELRLQIGGYLNTATDVDQEIQRFIHDVHTALYADITLGGVAINVRVTGDEHLYPTEPQNPICGFNLFVSVDYRAMRTDLTSIAT